MIKRTLLKLTQICVLLVFMTTFLGGCNSQSSPSTQSSAASTTSQSAAPTQKKVLKYVIGGGHTARSLEYLECAEDFFQPEVARRVEAETNYKIEWVKAYGTVAKLPEALKAVQSGTLEFGFLLLSPLAGQLPLHQFSIILPFQTSNPMTALKASKQIYKEFPVLSETFEKTYNQKFIALHGFADYGIFSTKKITNIDDLKGVKFGASGRNLLWIEGTGAVPINSNLSDGYTSLQTKLIDAQFCAATWGIKYKFPDITKYYTSAGSGSTTSLALTINNDVWKNMPEEVKKIVLEVAEEWSVKSTQMSIDQEAASLESIKKQGGEIIKMTEAERARWATSLPNIPDLVAKELGKDGLKILERYTKILREMGEPAAREWKFNY